MKLIIGAKEIGKFKDSPNLKTEFSTNIIFSVQLDGGDFALAMVVFDITDFDRIILPNGETFNREQILKNGDRVKGILETMER